MSRGFVGEDEADKDAEAGNAFALSMEADVGSRSRNQKTYDRSNVNCSDTGQAQGTENGTDK